MIRLNNYEIFNKHKTTLKETSKDEDNDIYMTNSLLEAINFDHVKTEHIKNLGLDTFPQSCDALFEETDKRLLFIEFKNGYFKDYEIHKKAYDSVLVFTDITSASITDMRKFAEFIFVYNKGKVCKREKKKSATVQDSVSLEDFENVLSKHAGTEMIYFGMKIFKNYCFKDVHTYTKEQFNLFLRDLKIN